MMKHFPRGLAGGTGGNLSLRIPGTDTVLIAPTGVALDDVSPDASVLVDLEGTILESPLGLSFREDVMAVVHVHPPYAAAFSCTGEPLPLRTVPSLLILKEAPGLPCFNPGSKELADHVTEAIRKIPDLKALLMEDHGILALGPDMYTAYYTADPVEHPANP
jgi:L-fuculose-phosphate aldolase